MTLLFSYGFIYPDYFKKPKLSLKHLSLYWKSQLLGWTIFTVVVFIFNALVYHDTLTFLPFGITMLILGLALSHLLKKLIKKLRILKRSFKSQVVLLLALAILFSMLGTLGWMLIMIAIGLWKIEGNNMNAWIADFFEEYFFNLFPVLLTFCGWVLIYFLFHYVRGVRKEERLKIKYKLERTELEAKALRAQMNPHFVFNCLNSIKSLIQEDQKDKSIVYLTTFSKLIRTLFNNADKKEITLYDEIETCKLYLQLEAMRFDAKFSYAVNVESNIDLKSIYVPALIIQPFIENSIWHGIVPKETDGYVNLSVTEKDGAVKIVVDDNGIGREASKLNKAVSRITHQSKGVNLTQSRLKLDNLLQRRQAQLETIDKKDDKGMASGTTVILKISEEVL
jgi:sensor histidine kinase YesM